LIGHRCMVAKKHGGWRVIPKTGGWGYCSWRCDGAAAPFYLWTVGLCGVGLTNRSIFIDFLHIPLI
jgi:hypothetical protein